MASVLSIVVAALVLMCWEAAAVTVGGTKNQKFDSPIYQVQIDTDSSEGQCWGKRVTILGYGVSDSENELPCSDLLPVSIQKTSVTVGDPATSSTAFYSDQPATLVVLQDGQCEKRTYSGEREYNTDQMSDSQCQTVKQKMAKSLASRQGIHYQEPSQGSGASSSSSSSSSGGGPAQGSHSSSVSGDGHASSGAHSGAQSGGSGSGFGYGSGQGYGDASATNPATNPSAGYGYSGSYGYNSNNPGAGSYQGGSFSGPTPGQYGGSPGSNTQGVKPFPIEAFSQPPSKFLRIWWNDLKERSKEFGQRLEHLFGNALNSTQSGYEQGNAQPNTQGTAAQDKN